MMFLSSQTDSKLVPKQSCVIWCVPMKWTWEVFLDGPKQLTAIWLRSCLNEAKFVAMLLICLKKTQFVFYLKFYSWFSFTIKCTFTANDFHLYSSFLQSSLPFCVYLPCDFHLFCLSYLLSTRPFSVYLCCDFHLFCSSYLLSTRPFCVHLSCDFHLFCLSYLLSTRPFSVYLSCDFHLFCLSYLLSTRPFSVYLSWDFHLFYLSFLLFRSLLLPISPVTFIFSSILFFLFWSLPVSLTVEVTTTFHLVMASGFVNMQRLHWHNTKSVPLDFWIIAGCNDIAFVHCNCDWKKQRLQWHCT